MSEAEREGLERLDRARELMRDDGIDALVLTDEPNVLHFSGLRTQSFRSRARPIAVVLPVDGDPALICSRSQAPNAQATSWIDDVLTFDGFEAEAVQTIAGAVDSRVLGDARLGLELGDQTRTGLSANGLDALRTRLSAAVVDGSSVIWGCRAIKSPDETALMAKAGAANAAALAETLAGAVAGVSERQLRSIWARRLTADFADPGYFAIQSGPESHQRVNAAATERVLAAGDLVWIDAGATLDGYWSDITRLTSVGEPTDEAQADYVFSHELVVTLVELARPGSTTAALATAALAAYETAELPMSRISRFGHGLGRELTEPPSISAEDPTVLAPGMTLAIETGISRPHGYFVVEDNIVITDEAPRLLAPRAPAQLPRGGT